MLMEWLYDDVITHDFFDLLKTAEAWHVDYYGDGEIVSLIYLLGQIYLRENVDSPCFWQKRERPMDGPTDWRTDRLL